MALPLSSNGETRNHLRDDLRTVRSLFVSMVEWLGDLSIFCRRLAVAAVTPPFEGAEIVRQMDAVGTRSLLVIALAGAATGVVLSLQTHDSLNRFGARSLLPAVVVFSFIRETGP